MILFDDPAQRLVDLFGRETFVTTAIDTDGSMVTDALHIIFRIGNKHFGIVRIRTVSRIRQPEVLPNHDTVAVAGFIQFFITNHTHPVTHDREVHIGMVSHRDIIFTCTVIQVRLTESPVTAPANKTTAVDKETQNLIILIEGHLADTDFKVFGIRYLIIYLKCEAGIIQVRLSIAFRPPETRILNIQLSEILCIEDNRFLFARSQFHRLLECDITDLAFQHTFYRICIMVLHDHFRRQFSRGRIGQRQHRFNKRISYRHFSGRCQEDIIPDTDITATHRRDPVPADRCMECRVISPQDTAVEVRALCILLFDSTDMLVLDDLYGYHILTRNDQVRYIELATHKGTFDAACLFSVYIYIRLPVDTVEIQEHTILFKVCRYLKLVTIPEIGIEERLGYLQLIICIVRIGNGTDILVTAQDSSRHRGNNPVFRLEAGSRYFFSRSRYFRSTLKFPVATGQIDFAFRCGRCSHRLWNQAAFTHHFQFAQDITAVVGRLLHQDTHITRILLTVQRDFIDQFLPTGKFSDIRPLFSIIGHLYFTFYGFVYPA